MSKLSINRFTTGITHINGEVDLYPGKFGFSMELPYTEDHGAPPGSHPFTEEEQDEIGEAIEHTLNTITEVLNKSNKRIAEEINE